MTRRETLPDAVIEAALALVRRRTGLVFSEARRPAFVSALRAAIRRAMMAPEALVQALDSDPALMDALTAEIVVGETYFLRDPLQWELLRTRIVPGLLARHRRRPLRIWSAGCSNGEEAYSAAITLHQIGQPSRAQVLGTDIALPGLILARQGEYSAWSLRNVPPAIVERYLERHGRRYRVRPEIRAQVEFRRLNLAEEESCQPYPVGPMDLILCRNVLIYLDEETVTHVARRLLATLSDGGCLLLGASDPLISGLVSCDVEVTQAGLVYRRQAESAAFPRDPASPWAGETHLEPKADLSVRSRPPVVEQVIAPARSVDYVTEIRSRYAARDYEGAIERAWAMIAAGARSAEGEVLLVRALANRGDLTEAGRACAAALDQHRDSAEIVYLHAVLLSEAGRFAESAAAFRRALYLDRRFIVAHLGLGTALSRLGDTAEARRALRTAARLLAAQPGDELVPAADGEPAARIAEAVRSQLRFLDGAVV